VTDVRALAVASNVVAPKVT